MSASVPALSAPIPKLSDAEFERVRSLIFRLAGISLADGKKDLVYRRLNGRVTALGLKNISDYCDRVERDAAEEQTFCDALTTNFTSFFREQHHFDFMVRDFIPAVEASAHSLGRRLRVWSAGCSTGEEPYSIAITLLEHFRDLGRWDARILATDLDTQVIEHAKAGNYSNERIERLPPEIQKRWFRPSVHAPNSVDIAPQPRQLITFKQLNLMSGWPMRGPFDIIFCRNVIIYFDKSTQATLVERFANLLRPRGYLVIGHSESLLNVSTRFEVTGKTIHRLVR
jgi:chemotaxis protein methyltransferase CheR